MASTFLSYTRAQLEITHGTVDVLYLFSHTTVLLYSLVGLGIVIVSMSLPSDV